MSRSCCNTIGGFNHRNDCPVYLKDCPKWLPEIDDEISDSGARQHAYMDIIGGMILYNGCQRGKICYCWIGANGWPTCFQVLLVEKERSVEWGLQDVIGPMDYNVPRATAEQMYEILRSA